MVWGERLAFPVYFGIIFPYSELLLIPYGIQLFRSTLLIGCTSRPLEENKNGCNIQQNMMSDSSRLFLLWVRRPTWSHWANASVKLGARSTTRELGRQRSKTFTFTH
eukprot:scaffold6091_cov164-Amphora_coffeaeformis.AAC.12